jgi:hypothetical protein
MNAKGLNQLRGRCAIFATRSWKQCVLNATR